MRELEIWVGLPMHDIAAADAIATKHRMRAIARRRVPANGLVVDAEEAMIMDKNGMRAELAAKCFLDPISWHADRDSVDLPDLGAFVDVKGVTNNRHSLASHASKTRSDWAYLLVGAQFCPAFLMIGWAWGRELISAGPTSLVPGRISHVIRQGENKLRHPMELLEIVHKRKVRDA